MIEGYLDGGVRRPAGAADPARYPAHDPTENDQMLFHWAAHFGLHVIIVATKADKIAKTRRKPRLAEIKAAVSGGVDYSVVAVSALEKTGTEELLEQIEGALAT